MKLAFYFLSLNGETLFNLLDYVTRRSESLGFKKKKKKILPDITVKLFAFGVIRNH